MKKITKLLTIPVLVISLAGCGKIPTLENGEQVVITVKEGDISAESLYQDLKNKYSKYILADLIDTIILNEKYEETDEEKEYIDEYLNDIEEAAKQYNYTAEQFIQANYGFETTEEFKSALSLNYKREQAVKDYLKKEITDKEVEKYYEENIYGDIKAKHILISPETLDGMTSEEIQDKKDEALKLAKDIIKKLKNGEKFDDLAKEYSDDSSNKNEGGDLGWFNTGEMVEEFEKAAFALKKGKYTTTPIETKFGYHIIYKTDEKDKPKLKEVKDEILDTLVENKLKEDSTLFYKTLEDIRKESELEIVDSELKDMYNDYMDSLITSSSSN